MHITQSEAVCRNSERREAAALCLQLVYMCCVTINHIHSLHALNPHQIAIAVIKTKKNFLVVVKRESRREKTLVIDCTVRSMVLCDFFGNSLNWVIEHEVILELIKGT